MYIYKVYIYSLIYFPECCLWSLKRTLCFNCIYFFSPFYTEKWRRQQYHEVLDYIDGADEQFWEHITEMNTAAFNQTDEDTIICWVSADEWWRAFILILNVQTLYVFAFCTYIHSEWCFSFFFSLRHQRTLGEMESSAVKPIMLGLTLLSINQLLTIIIQ